MSVPAPQAVPVLIELEQLPEGFLEVDARMLHEVLAGPTLIHLPGRRQEPLFVSILLHGNEDVGLLAVQRVLGAMQDRPLPRALSIFVGNVAAARENVRRLEAQPDYNRVWPGTAEGACVERDLMQSVVDTMRARGVFASVDLHNNTGLNPHYGCITQLRSEDLQLASIFSRTVVYFRRPLGTQTSAFAGLCPSVTCECGRTGDAAGLAHAVTFLDACLHLAEIPSHPVRAGDVHLFHTVATVRVPAATTFSFDGSAADLLLGEDLEWFNFRELPAGTLFARCADAGRGCLEVRDETGREVRDEFLALEDGEIRLRREVMPSMITRNAQVIRQDCLCYFMERYPLPG